MSQEPVTTLLPLLLWLLGTQEATMQGLDQSKQPLLLLLPSPPVLLTTEAADGQYDTVTEK